MSESTMSRKRSKSWRSSLLCIFWGLQKSLLKIHYIGVSKDEDTLNAHEHVTVGSRRTEPHQKQTTKRTHQTFMFSKHFFIGKTIKVVRDQHSLLIPLKTGTMNRMLIRFFHEITLKEEFRRTPKEHCFFGKSAVQEKVNNCDSLSQVLKPQIRKRDFRNLTFFENASTVLCASSHLLKPQFPQDASHSEKMAVHFSKYTVFVNCELGVQKPEVAIFVAFRAPTQNGFSGSRAKFVKQDEEIPFWD